MPSVPFLLAVLVSGEGSNLQSLIDRADPAYRIAVVISDRYDVGALDRARSGGIPVEVVDWSTFASREEFTSAVCGTARLYQARGLVLAGFMRILAPSAVRSFPNAIINVHPALLPSFPGVHAVEQALESSVTYTGVTVHFVDEQVDHGPTIAQRIVPVHEGDDVDALRDRIQKVEHELLPDVVAAFATGDLFVESSVVRWRAPLSATGTP